MGIALSNLHSHCIVWLATSRCTVSSKAFQSKSGIVIIYGLSTLRSLEHDDVKKGVRYNNFLNRVAELSFSNPFNDVLTVEYGRLN
jgi:hypothetical protein